MNVVKRTVDVCITAVLLCLMSYQVMGETLHEWGGIAMTALFIVHHALNYRWCLSLFKGGYNAFRAVTVAVNALLFLSFALTALCGMAMSSHAVPFLYGFLPVSFARRFHLAASYWTFVLTGVHLGLHIPAMIRPKGRARTAALALGGAAAAAGLWLFIANGIPRYIFFLTPFAFFDYSKPAALVFAENLLMLSAFACLGVILSLAVKRKKTA